ncbi:MAG: hypothetical protein ACOC5E_00870, partial [Acidobacteriota bacterium]
MSRPRLSLSIAVLTLLSLVVAGPALAQSSAEEQTGSTTVVSVEGTVLESDAASALVRTDDGDMRFVIRNAEHQPEYLAPGTRVRIWYRGTAETEFRATRIAPSEETPAESPAGDMEESAESAEDTTASDEAETGTPRETETSEESASG